MITGPPPKFHEIRDILNSNATAPAAPTTCANEPTGSHKEALRRLKRRLSDVVYRCLIRDADQQNGAGPGGHQGAATNSSAAGSTPTTGSSDKSLPEPATTDPAT